MTLDLLRLLALSFLKRVDSLSLPLPLSSVISLSPSSSRHSDSSQIFHRQIPFKITVYREHKAPRGEGRLMMPDVLAKGRASCYKARDAFYACLEKEADKKPTEVATVGLLYPADCKKSRAEFVKQCRPTWVKHFDRQYCAKKRVQRLLDNDGTRRGPISLPQPYTFKP